MELSTNYYKKFKLPRSLKISYNVIVSTPISHLDDRSAHLNKVQSISK